MFPSIAGWPIDQCQSCSHRFCRGVFDASHTDEQYGDAYFHGDAVGYPDYFNEAQSRRRQARQYCEIIRKVAKKHGLARGRQALDIGCAAGFLMQGFADGGWQVSGVDPNASMVVHARNRLGLVASVGRQERLRDSPDLSVPSAGFDLVSMVQVIGHSTDPGKAIAEAAAVMAADGILLIETWDSQSKLARLFGERWHEYSPPNVLHYFTRTSLTRLARQHGLVPVSFGKAPKRLQIEHLCSFVAHRYTGPLGRLLASILSRLPANWGLPYPGDDLFYAIFRRQPL